MSVANGAFTRTNSFGPESRGGRLAGLLPQFEMQSVPDPVASEREGRPIFKDVEIVQLLTPGNMLNIPVEKVTQEHREQWPREYQAFKAGHEISADGTPLEQWPILRKSQVAELKAMHLFTVEHVRDMSDHVCQRFMGGMRLRALAKAFLDDAEAGALLSQVTAANEKKDREIAELRAKVDELSTLLSSVHTQMQMLRDAPSPLATAVPGMSDPIEQMKRHGPVDAGGASALDALPEPRAKRKANV